MAYIRNRWYPAVWSNSLHEQPIGRVFLEEEVVLYRTPTGDPVALSDVCPHRFAALSKGKLHGDAISCPYHGLQFAPDGSCRHNPHGPATGAIRVRTYPLAERHGMVWIWMGDSTKANPDLLPEIPSREDPAIDWVSGYLTVEGNYQLVIDNLLDLSHVEFMHPFLAVLDDKSPTDITCFEDGEAVVSRYVKNGTPRTRLVEALWPEAPATNLMQTEMRWSAPANLIQNNVFSASDHFDAAPDESLLVPLCHLITPQTATSAHYFWASGRNRRRNDSAVDELLEEGISATFSGEDEPMIADIQHRMGDRNLFDLKPLLLPIDKSAVLARRRVERLIGQEAELSN